MKRLTFTTLIDPITGYGQQAMAIARGLSELAHVSIRPIRTWEAWGAKIPADIRAMFVNAVQPEPWELLMHPPDFCPTPGKRTVYLCMWEATRLPPAGVDFLNKAEVVVTPSAWNASCFSAQGVEARIRVVPLGIDTDRYRYKVEPESIKDLCVFGCAGRMAHGGKRKGIEEVIELFGEAFPHEQDVRLKVKCFPDCPLGRPLDKRVEIVQAHLSDEQLVGWFEHLHCFVSMARSEGWGLCLDPGTTVLTGSRAMDIKDVQVGDTVLGSDGTGRRVVATSTRMAANRIRVKIRGVPLVIATGEHPFYAIKTVSKKPITSARRRMDLKPEWIRADELKKGYLVAIPKPNLNAPLPKTLDIYEFLGSSLKMEHSAQSVWAKMGFSPKTRALIKLNRHIEFSDRFLNFIGWYLAEGSPNNGSGIEIDLHIDELPIALEITAFVRDVFGLSGTIRKKKDSKCLRVQIASMILSRLMTTLCGNGAKSKTLHPMLYRSGEFLGPLLRAFAMGDGHYKKGSGWEIMSSSRNLIWQISHVLQSAGMHAPMFKHTGGLRLDLRGDVGRRFCEWSGISICEKRQRSAMKMNAQRDGYFFVPVRGIECMQEAGPVVNLEVDGDHTFLANGVVVHNCQHQALAIGRPLITPRFGGVAEFFQPEFGWAVGWRLEPAQYHYAECGCWAEPDRQAMVAAMREVYANKALALRRGAVAAANVGQFSQERTVRELGKVLTDCGAL